MVQKSQNLFEAFPPFPIGDGAMFQFIDKNGACNEELLKQWLPDVTPELMRQMYQEMVTIRMADEKVIKLQRSGRMGTYPSMQGQEACQVGGAHGMAKDDWLLPAFRELGVMWLRGAKLEQIYLYWAGNEIGSKLEGTHVLPVSIVVGGHPIHAVGIAWAEKIKKGKAVSVSYFSDGATSEGDFHAAMNFAGVFKVPTVFFCQNNQWAISTPRSKQTASKTLAQKAIAYGFDGILIDGNDVLAVYATMRAAVEKARAGGGPTFIEAETYRLGDHTTSDDWTKYRSKEEVEREFTEGPLPRMQKYLAGKGLWTEAWQKEIEEDAKAKIADAVKKMEAQKDPTLHDIFDNMYAEMTPQLQEQYDELKTFFSS